MEWKIEKHQIRYEEAGKDGGGKSVSPDSGKRYSLPSLYPELFGLCPAAGKAEEKKLEFFVFGRRIAME